MRLPRRIHRMAVACAFLCCGTFLRAPSAVQAGGVQLKNGLHIEGDPVPLKGLNKGQIERISGGPTEVYPILMIHAGFKRYFVRRSNAEKIDFAADLNAWETYKFNPPRGRRRRGWSVLGSVQVLTPFSKFGIRTVKIFKAGGRTVEVVQGITEITPKQITLRGITHVWEHGMALTSIPHAQLDAILRQKTDLTKPGGRMKIARFYIQAGKYQAAAKELDAIAKQFPDYAKKVKAVQFDLRQQQGTRIINELRRRKAAGQHRLVLASCAKFPTKDISARLTREIKKLQQDYAVAKKRAEKVLMLLSDLHAKLKETQLVSQLAPFRSEVREKLDYDSLSRLDAFLKLSTDPTLSVQEKLALAYSGWILGSGKANTKLDLTIRLWNARFLVSEYLRTVNALERQKLLKKIQRLEGVSPEHIGQILLHLPPLIETPEVKPGRAHTVTVAGRKTGGTPIRYSVLLPPEYNPHRKYPTIVALRMSNRSCEDELAWWGGRAGKPGQSQRHGYIVIAPDYCAGKPGDYDYSTAAHRAVIESLRDARKRFRIDSDRVFLSGHGTGGDAAFDIGMSHPDLFAGVIPITGISDKYCMWYYYNTRHLPFYVVGGELARHSLERNSRELNRMMHNTKVYDIIYCEYIGRGYESFYAEIHKLFDWMDLRRRAKYLKEVDVKILRPSDDHFYWVTASGFSPNVTGNTVLVQGGRRRPNTPMSMLVRVTPKNNKIQIKSAARHHTLWLSPQIVDFDERVEVSFNGRKRFSGFLKRDVETLLEVFRVRGDREKPVWARLEINRSGKLIRNNRVPKRQRGTQSLKTRQ
ncbi:MAG: hypothetical protein IID45_05465 [Planctomycetes bacterium]|nr:hypothetical protein [Planctomycetota bacterium]